MKKLILLAATVLLSGSFVLAQTTTTPMKVLVVPFKLVNDTSSHAWVGAALQENMISDVAGAPGVQAVGLNHPLANVDAGDAQHAGREAGASIVVFGSFQFSDEQLRVTGQAMDVGSGHTLATLQATGPVLDLFKIEDALGSQLSPALPQAPSNPNLAQVTYGPTQSATPLQTTAAVNDNNAAAPQVYPDASQQYAAPSTTYVYPYGPSYSYGYPYYYPYSPVYIYGGFGYPYYRSWGGFRGPWFGSRGGGRWSGGGGHGSGGRR
jgi:TolB-like protein